MMAKRSPDGLTIIGSTRLSMADVATAASIALPPFFRMSRPTWAASGWLVAIMPLRAITSERRCKDQPSARSPSTALHPEGFDSPPHGLIGDCARGDDTPSATTPRPIATQNVRLLVMCALSVSRDPAVAGATRHVSVGADYMATATTN